MLSVRSALAALVLTFVLSGGADAGRPSPGDIGAQWAAAWSRQDLDGVMAFYAPDAVFMPQSGERWTGVAVIRTNFSKLLEQYRADLHLKSVRAVAGGSLAFDSGTYEETVTKVGSHATPMHFKGNYLFVLRRNKQNQWRLIEQSWTSLGAQGL